MNSSKLKHNNNFFSPKKIKMITKIECDYWTDLLKPNDKKNFNQISPNDLQDIFEQAKSAIELFIRNMIKPSFSLMIDDCEKRKYQHNQTDTVILLMRLTKLMEERNLLTEIFSLTA